MLVVRKHWPNGSAWRYVMKVRIVMMELIGKIEVAHHGLEYVLKNHGSWISLFATATTFRGETISC